MTKKTVNSLVRCCAVTGLLLAGAARSEATTLTLTDAGDSVTLCVPGSPTSNTCGVTGLSNWLMNGVVYPLQAWLSYVASPDGTGPTAPPTLGGTIDSISNPTISHTSSTAHVGYSGPTIGLLVDYALIGPGHSVSQRIAETITVKNLTNWYMNVHLTDGIGLDEYLYVHPYDTLSLETAYTANPEPVSMVLLGTGLLVAARARRRRSEPV